MIEYFFNLIDKKFSIDTRSIQQGDVFVALKGENVDGNDFIGNAFNLGASYAIADVSSRKNFIGNCYFEKIIFVPDVVKFLFDFAIYKRKRLINTTFVGVIGSVGKTTTRELIYRSLNFIGKKVYRSQKNFNNNIGVPISIANTDNDSDFSIIELGINHVGEMDSLASVLNPDILVITEISGSHMGNFKSLMDIANEKLKALRYVKQDGFVIADGIGTFSSIINKMIVSPIFYYKNDLYNTEKTKFNVALQKYEYDKCADTVFVYVDLSLNSVVKDYRFILNVKDLSIIKNMVICLSFLVELINRKIILEDSLDMIFECLKNFIPVSGRGSVHKLFIAGKNITLIDQAYNASISSIRSSIMSARYFYPGNITVVLGDVGELGDFSKSEHLKLLAIMDKNRVNKVYMCGVCMKEVFDLLDDTKKCKWSKHSEDLISDIINNIDDGDVIIVKGSHMMNMSCIIDYFISNFS